MLEPEAHVVDDATAYALGELDDVTRARIEEHALGCDQCTRALGEAEASVLRIIESEPMPQERPAFLDRHLAFTPRSPQRTPWIFAIAAVLVVALLHWGTTVLHDRAADDAARERNVAMTAMLNSHFLHAAFAPRVPGAPSGKAIYARDRSWMYVLVAPGPDALQVTTVSANGSTVAASLPASSQVREAFIQPATGINTVQLVDRGAISATATIR